MILNHTLLLVILNYWVTSLRFWGFTLHNAAQLYKFSPLNGHITSALKADTFLTIVSSLVPISDINDKKKDQPEAVACGGRHTASIIVEILTLLGQIACKGKLIELTGEKDLEKYTKNIQPVSQRFCGFFSFLTILSKACVIFFILEEILWDSRSSIECHVQISNCFVCIVWTI